MRKLFMFLFIAVCGLSFCQTKYVKDYNLKIGEVFPPLSLNSPNGKVNLDSYKGKIIVINWWATYCPPCIGEIPGLNKLVQKYKNKPVVFLAIVWDKNNLEEFLKKHRFDYKQLYGDSAAKKILGIYVPRNIIINKSNKILYNELGGETGVNWKVLDKIIDDNLQYKKLNSIIPNKE